jgi:hypothetical protein
MYLLVVYVIILSSSENIASNAECFRKDMEGSSVSWFEELSCCLYRMRCTKRNLSQESKSLGQGWSPGAPDYYARLLSFWLQCLVKGCRVYENADTVLYVDMNTVLSTW